MADERLWAVTSTSLAPDPQFCYTTWQTQFTIWRLSVHSAQCLWHHLCLCACVSVCYMSLHETNKLGKACERGRHKIRQEDMINSKRQQKRWHGWERLYFF